MFIYAHVYKCPMYICISVYLCCQISEPIERLELKLFLAISAFNGDQIKIYIV